MQPEFFFILTLTFLLMLASLVLLGTLCKLNQENSRLTAANKAHAQGHLELEEKFRERLTELYAQCVHSLVAINDTDLRINDKLIEALKIKDRYISDIRKSITDTQWAINETYFSLPSTSPSATALSSLPPGCLPDTPTIQPTKPTAEINETAFLRP